MNVICKTLDPYKKIAIEYLSANNKFNDHSHTVIFLEEMYYSDISAIMEELLHCIINYPTAQVIVLSERDNPCTIHSRLSITDFTLAVNRKLSEGDTAARLYLYYYDIIKPRKTLRLYLMIYRKYLQIGNINQVAEIYNLKEKQVYYYITRLKEIYGLKSVQNLVLFLKWIGK